MSENALTSLGLTVRWTLVLYEAIVNLERLPHPAHCGTNDEDECDCGLDQALSLLWLIAKAPGGQVDAEHPLRHMRNSSFAEYQARRAIEDSAKASR